jgi:hypothetical protein
MATLAEILRQTGYVKDGTLAAPATDSPMTKALSEHIKTLPQQLATNQAAMNKSMGGMFKTDMATGQPNPNYYPEAISEVTQLIPNFMGMIKGTTGKPMTFYHGTNHEIQQFKPNTFFTSNPEAASSYALDRGYGGPGANVIPTYLDIKKVATTKDIDDIAKKLKIYNDEFPTYEYVSPNISNDANKVIAELKKKGFEGAKVPDFDMNERSIESLVVFDPNKIKFKYQKPSRKELIEQQVNKVIE